MSFEGKLIKLVRERKCLYLTRSRAKLNKLNRVNAWKCVSDELGRPVAECRLRWRTLRDRFVKEKKKLDQAENVSCVDLERWEFYDAMRFITPFLRSSRVPKTFNVMCETFLDPNNCYDEPFTILPDDFSFDENIQKNESKIEGSATVPMLEECCATDTFFSDESGKSGESAKRQYEDLLTYSKEALSDLFAQENVTKSNDALSETHENCISFETGSALDATSFEETFQHEPLSAKLHTNTKSDPQPILSDFSREKSSTTPHINNYLHFRAAQNSSRPKKPITTLNDSKVAFVELMKGLNTAINLRFSSERDDNDLFLEFIGKKMKTLSEEAKLRIQTNLFANVTEELRKKNAN